MTERQSIREPARETSVLAETDVIVCGGGPAGVGAALAAARNGARTLLIERGICLGGMATAGLMNRLGPYHDQKRPVVAGIPGEVLASLVAVGAAHPSMPCSRQDPERYWVPFDPETLKVVLDEMMQEAGVEVLFDVFAVGAIVDANAMAGVIVEGKMGRRAIQAKVVVDATGDGDVAARAGAPWVKGRQEDGLMQPITLMNKLHNQDWPTAKRYVSEHRDRLLRLREDAARGCDAAPKSIAVGTDNLLRADETYFNGQHVHGIDGTDPRQITRAAIEARREIWRNLRFLQQHVPGCKTAYLASTASLLGVRESRRILGEYVLTGDDVLQARDFDDAVARYACWIDVHTIDPSKPPGAYAGRGPEPGTSYAIPFRCLVPRTIENLLVAGRCFSASHEGLASARMMPCCMAMGQAAGAAAALCVKNSVSPRGLDVALLRRQLEAQNVIL